MSRPSAASQGKLTAAEQRVLGAVAHRCMVSGCAVCSKRDLADDARCSEKTVDRAVRSLRDRGFLEVECCFDGSGAQTANAYKLPAGVLGYTGR